MVFDPNNLITRITEGGPPSVDPSTREKIAVLLQHALVPGAKPARIFVRTNTLLRPQEMTAFLRPTETHSVQVESDGPNSFRVFLYQPTGVVGWVTLMPLDSTVGADLVLRCDHSVLTIETDKRPARVPGPSEPVTPLIAGPSEPVTPLIVMDDVPLIIAIRNLARQINLEYSLDPGIQMFQCGPKGELRPQPSVSIRWENVTARQALVALLANNGLVLVEHSTTGTPRIYERDPCKEVFAEPAVRQQLDKWWKDTLRSQERAFHGPNLKSPMNFRIALQPPTPIRPTHIALRSDETPSTRVIEDFFSDHSVRIETAGSNAFRIFLRQPEACTAAELLAWSNRLEPDFEVIREGLKRPYAQVGGNYDRPSTVPIPNFVSTRTLAQTLAARAQAHLLVGEPDKALRDLTLLHQMSRLFEAKPAGRPITLVGAMINVAITGLYVQAVADGFQLHAWQEPQLAALQQQLREVNLMAPVAEALRLEQAWPSRTLDITPARELIPLLVSFESRDKSLWEMLKEKPALFTLFCMPRGWKEQNKVVHARLLQMMIESYDSTNQIISPRKLAVYGDEVNAMVNRGVSPYRFIAAMITPSFVRCNQTTARNQTSVNEAAVACALERHRVAHGHYPETLDALAPQFKLPHDVINGQPLKYHRTGDGDFSLYSIGWNETDDGGADIDINNGDWVWPPKS
jgi:hypothetical protein